MNETDGRRPARANLSVGTRVSYGFAVEADIGRRSTRYLIGRRFGGHSALTVLFVSHPPNLAGTHVWIIEDSAAGTCEVETYVPTMKAPLRLVERHILGYLPLTDIGYLDLMAWRYPGLGQAVEEHAIDVSWSKWAGADARTYRGPASSPGLTVTEATDAVTGLVVARSVDRLGVPVRRWEVLDLGDLDTGYLPRRVHVSRPETGHRTELRRTTEPVDIPEGEFTTVPARLGRTIDEALAGKAS